MKQLTVIFDNAPLPSAQWMKDVCQTSKLTLVEQSEIGAILGSNQEFQQALLKGNVVNYTMPHESLKPFYRTALSEKTKGQNRIALHGWGWLVYAPSVDACVFDFSGLEPERKKVLESNVAPAAQVEEHFEKIKNLLRDHAKQVLSPDKILELPLDATESQKKSLVQAFFQKLRI